MSRDESKQRRDRDAGDVKTRVSRDGVVIVRSGPADQETEDAIERWLLSLLAEGKAVR